MDTPIQLPVGYGVCRHQYPQTGNPFQDLDARIAESLVRPSRHCLHDVLCRAWSSHGNGSVSAVHQEERCHRRRTRHHRQPCLCRPVVHHTRYAHGGTLGQGCLGTLLGLGPERDLGSHYLVSLFSLYPLSSVPTFTPEAGPHHAHRVLLPAANVLVGHQLLAFSAGSQRAYL